MSKSSSASSSTPSPSALSTALLVVDAQESFRHRPYWNARDADRFAGRLQALIDGAVARGIPVVQILHVEETGVFSLASGYVTTMTPIVIAPDALFHKRSHSALVGSGLDVWLTQRGIRRVIVSGIRTEQCCETTTRHASDIGYEVDYVTEATLTFEMTDRHGRVWSPAEITERTELALDGRFARIVTVDEALADHAPIGNAPIEDALKRTA
jgi:nicotinamidase-related amidase